MEDICSRQCLLLSLQRALLGEVHPQLRQASIEADSVRQVVRLRFEYEGDISEVARSSCSSAATEVISDFPAPWQLDEQHLSTSDSRTLSPLAHVGYRRAEAQPAV